MKIMIIVHALTGGGAERVAVSWANGLSELGHQVDIISNLTNQTYKTNKTVNLIQRKILYKKSNSIFAKTIRILFNQMLSFIQLIRYFILEKPDAVIDVLYLNAYSLLLARILSGQKFPIVMTDHNAYERPKGHGFKYWQWRNKFIDNRLFDIVTVLTKRDKEILQRHKINNVEVLYNPLFISPVKTIPQKQKVVLAVGRLDAWHVKGFDLLIKAWKDISRIYPDWKLRIVGHGSKETRDRLAGLAEETINSIEFVPYTSNIEPEYQNASIFVLSSRYEGWGLVMIEAMSQGCAVVACDYHGRQAEVIKNGQNGILCEVNNCDSLKKAIVLLIKDRTMRDKIRINAIKSVGEYNELKVALRIESMLNKLINE